MLSAPHSHTNQQSIAHTTGYSLDLKQAQKKKKIQEQDLEDCFPTGVVFHELDGPFVQGFISWHGNPFVFQTSNAVLMSVFTTRRRSSEPLECRISLVLKPHYRSANPERSQECQRNHHKHMCKFHKRVHDRLARKTHSNLQPRVSFCTTTADGL